MKKFITITLVLILSLAACGGNSGTPNGDDVTANNTEVEQIAELPTLDKTITDENLVFSFKIPTTWDFNEKLSDPNGVIFDIDCLNNDIFMRIGGHYNVSTAVADEFLINLRSTSQIMEEFAFSNGNMGYYAKNDERIVFINEKRTADKIDVLMYEVNYRYDREWFNRNEALIYMVAKTLEINQ